MKGIILAGGTGSRLSPLTKVMNKHLLPVYDRPMILYPLATLASFGISDVLIVTGGEHLGMFAEFLGDGSAYGVRLTFRIQPKPGGIAEALSYAEEFAGRDQILVILGDNVFGDIHNNHGLVDKKDHAQIWVKQVPDAKRFGVLVKSAEGSIPAIEEKPHLDGEGWAVTGLYCYPPDVFEIIRGISPSTRGELEITDVNNIYLKADRCSVAYLEDGDFWSDAGTFNSLLRASNWAGTV